MKKIKKYEIAGFFAILVIIGIYFLANKEVLNIENLNLLIKESGIFAPIIFSLLFVFLTLIGSPITFSVTAAGILFGPIYGFSLSLFLLTLSGVLAFKISRYFQNKFVKNNPDKESKNLIIKIKNKINDHLDNHGLKTIVFLRLIFIPYIETSYAAGLVSKLKFKDFFIGTFLINIVYCIIYITLGASITKNIKWFILALILFGIFLIIPRIIKKLKLYKNEKK